LTNRHPQESMSLYLLLLYFQLPVNVDVNCLHRLEQKNFHNIRISIRFIDLKRKTESLRLYTAYLCELAAPPNARRVVTNTASTAIYTSRLRACAVSTLPYSLDWVEL